MPASRRIKLAFQLLGIAPGAAAEVNGLSATRVPEPFLALFSFPGTPELTLHQAIDFAARNGIDPPAEPEAAAPPRHRLGPRQL